VSDEAEAIMRGGHAYHGLSRAGDDAQQALARVEKYHFNYNDLSALDESIKKVSPFFMFFSRNMALQAQMFAKRPGKINRMYANVKRNFDWASEDDPNSPDWLSGILGGIRTPFGGEAGGRMYFTPDIPTINALEEATNPGRMLGGQLGPGVGTALQAISGKDFFTGRDLGNSMTTYAGGEQVARQAPLPYQIPGVKQLLSALPGADIYNDQLLMTGGLEKILGSMNPQLGRIDKLVSPETRGAANAGKQSWASILGVPVTWNSPNYQAGTEYGREVAERDAASQMRTEELLNMLTGG
jgi:hypothetical protein